MTKLTKQGVRDLSDLKGKPAGVKLEEPPIPIKCKHRNMRTRFSCGMYWMYCDDCNVYVGEPW